MWVFWGEGVIVDWRRLIRSPSDIRLVTGHFGIYCRSFPPCSEESIQMMSGLVLQLMQSVVQLPEVPDESTVGDDDIDEEELRRRRKRKVDNDVFIEQSYTQALQVAHNFLARLVVGVESTLKVEG